MGYSIYHGVVGVGAKPPLRRRVTYNDANLTESIVSAAAYSVYTRLAGGSWEALTGQTDVTLTVADTIHDDLQNWDVDEIGFNIEVFLSSTLDSPFTEWGKEYLVAVTLVLTDGVVDGFAWLVRTP